MAILTRPVQSGDIFTVMPGGPLEGKVQAGGAKNSALKLMAACLLAEGTHVLKNVPFILDVEIMSELLEAIGAKIHRHTGAGNSPANHSVAGSPAQGASVTNKSTAGAHSASGAAPDTGDLVIEIPATLSPEAPYELVEKIRASIVVLGPLLGRVGRARVSLPGGDDFGNRPVDMHIDSLARMGTRFKTTHGYIEGIADAGRLSGSRVVLEYPSHTATDNVLMASVLAEGTTVIENAAREPEIADLASMLTSMGARINGAGTSRITVEGVPHLRPASHTVIPDRVVAATFAAAVAIAGGDVTIEDARSEHMDTLLRKMAQMGVRVTHKSGGLRIQHDYGSRLSSVDVSTLPYPGVATDYAPFIVTMLSVADGVGIVSENLFPGRFRYVDELARLGADISTEGHHAVVRGVKYLQGAPVKAPDLRGGAALVLAGLVAEGQTTVSNTQHIDRGYEDLADKLASLGAQVRRTQTQE
ncbi:MAG: UDP-N-acetylglucosamine 1-carboxyvinyltransferase [Acidimicrobiales bacterium]